MKHTYFSRIAYVLLIAILSITLCSCTSPDVRKRAFGYFRLGNIKNFPVDSTTNLTDEGLLVRRDKSGISVMSTLCTHDLSSLMFDGKRFSSPNSRSTYDDFGRVLTGPATANLPYFKVVLDAALYGGPKDTLYARVGVEVPETWRLVIPES